jgi:hypothetical protein
MRKHVRLPLGPTAPEQKVTQRRVGLTIAGKEVTVQTVPGDAAEIDFGVLEFNEGDEFVCTASDGDAAGNWSEPRPNAVRLPSATLRRRLLRPSAISSSIPRTTRPLKPSPPEHCDPCP